VVWLLGLLIHVFDLWWFVLSMRGVGFVGLVRCMVSRFKDQLGVRWPIVVYWINAPILIAFTLDKFTVVLVGPWNTVLKLFNYGEKVLGYTLAHELCHIAGYEDEDSADYCAFKLVDIDGESLKKYMDSLVDWCRRRDPVKVGELSEVLKRDEVILNPAKLLDYIDNYPVKKITCK